MIKEHDRIVLTQPVPVFVHRGGAEPVEIHVEVFGRRAVIVRLATRALKALRASSIPLRPRYARLTALTARAATRVLATIDGQNGSA